MLAGFPSKAATAICTFAYSSGPGAEPVIFEGTTQGHIVPARGETRFGSVEGLWLGCSFADFCAL